MKKPINKIVEPEQTPEEKAISHFMLMTNIEMIPEPNRFFEIGETVEIGNLLNCKIVKPLFEGKAYLIDYTSVDHNYGKPILKEHTLNGWTWLDIFKPNERKESLIKNADLRMNYRQQGIMSLIDMIYHFGVNMSPTYQREFVWDKEDKIALIDSIFNSIDTGKFVFVRGDYSDKMLFEILDGKQRLSALREFYEDKLLYNGLKFSELSSRERGFFENYAVSTCEISECDLKKKLRVFYHLNISGKVMDKAHLEKVKGMIEEMESKK